MTKVKFMVCDDQLVMKSEGHAGDKMVCCACSTLDYTLLNALMSHRSDVGYNINEGIGQFEVEVHDPDDKARAFFEMAKVGYAALQDKYPENVQVV